MSSEEEEEEEEEQLEHLITDHTVSTAGSSHTTTCFSGDILLTPANKHQVAYFQTRLADVSTHGPDTRSFEYPRKCLLRQEEYSQLVCEEAKAVTIGSVIVVIPSLLLLDPGITQPPIH
ncbi:hypothetical protein BV898_17387 [Hypsibius exemplaris]|uniref:Uncharacterized protein n=1 Tax=Hypsibius exemplaris TaxID=2072580 RepID=A0A9X6NFI2_HYPEX|nr:hypothetical protein BV898_17387 [Hypsibius exemplaris]